MAKATTRTYRATTDGVTNLQRSRGFTLIEIVVVITIIAVAAAIALPAINAGARQREVRRSLQTFVSTVRRASSLSVFERRPVELTVFPREARYSVSNPRSRGEAAVTERETAGRGLFPRRRGASAGDEQKGEFAVSLPGLASFGDVEGGRDLGDEGVVFDFYPNGSSSGGRFELLFDTGRGRPISYVVVVNPLISSVSLEDE